jgi:hypothetical protein
MKKYTFGDQKGKNRPPEPKNVMSIEREFYMEQEKIYFQGVKKAKISFQSSKMKL